MIPNFQIHTISLRECRRCKSMWASDAEKLLPGEKINIVKVSIGFCLACADSFSKEENYPTYQRHPRNKLS